LAAVMHFSDLNAVLERWSLQRGSIKSECMDHPPGQNVPVVKRWPLVEVQLYQQKRPAKTAFYIFGY